MNPSLLLASSLETALNRYLALDPEVQATPLTGRVIAIDCKAPRFTLWIVGAADRIQVLHAYEGQADVTLSGTLLALVSLSRGQVVGSGVEIRGNTGVGQQFQDLLRAVQVDWEEGLSAWVGDVPAHQIGNLVRGAGAWGKQAAVALQRNVSEYLREEARDLPNRPEVERFMDDVDRLRSDVDRLEARVRRLEARRARP